MAIFGKKFLMSARLLVIVALSTSVSLANTDSPTQAREPATEPNELSYGEAVDLAARIYRPEDRPLPDPWVLLQIVDAPASGLYAEIYTTRAAADGTVPVEESLDSEIIVAIRGTDFDKVFTRPSELSADLRAAALGGMPQWWDLRGPLTDQLRAAGARRLTLIGHSLGGMVAQLAAAQCVGEFPELEVSVFLFGVPGVMGLVDPRFATAFPETLRITHLVHQQDPLARMSRFGTHHPSTHWYLVDSDTNAPHSLSSIQAYLKQNASQLLAAASPEEVFDYLTRP